MTGDRRHQSPAGYMEVAPPGLPHFCPRRGKVHGECVDYKTSYPVKFTCSLLFFFIHLLTLAWLLPNLFLNYRSFYFPSKLYDD